MGKFSHFHKTVSSFLIRFPIPLSFQAVVRLKSEEMWKCFVKSKRWYSKDIVFKMQVSGSHLSRSWCSKFGVGRRMFEKHAGWFWCTSSPTNLWKNTSVKQWFSIKTIRILWRTWVLLLPQVSHSHRFMKRKLQLKNFVCCILSGHGESVPKFSPWSPLFHREVIEKQKEACSPIKRTSDSQA